MPIQEGTGTLPPWWEPPGQGDVGTASPANINSNAQGISNVTLNTAVRNTIIPIVYGRSRVPAKVFLLGTFRLSFTYLLIGAAWCQGEIDGIEEIFLDGIPWADWTTETGNTRVATAPPPGMFPVGAFSFDGLESFLGTADQEPAWSFTGRANGITPNPFSFGAGYNDSLPNVAYTAFMLDPRDDFTSLPKIEAIVRGFKVYDPRDVTQSLVDPSTYKWSSNAVLILADFITRFADIPVDWHSVEIAADWAGARVDTGDPATPSEEFALAKEVRRLIGFSISKQVLLEDWIRLLSEYAATFVVKDGGKYVFIPDKPTTPVAVITSGDYLNDSLRLKKKGLFNSPNQVEVRYTLPSVDGDWIEETVSTPEPVGDFVRKTSLSMPAFQSKAIALRYATERLNKEILQDTEISFLTDDKALKYLRGELVTLAGVFGLPDMDVRILSNTPRDLGRWEVKAVKFDPNVYSTTVLPDPTNEDNTIPSPLIDDGPTLSAEKVFDHRGMTVIHIYWDGTTITRPDLSMVEVHIFDADGERMDLLTTGCDEVMTGTVAPSPEAYPSPPDSAKARIIVPGIARGAFGAEVDLSNLSSTFPAGPTLSAERVTFGVDNVRLRLTWTPLNDMPLGSVIEITLFDVNDNVLDVISGIGGELFSSGSVVPGIHYPEEPKTAKARVVRDDTEFGDFGPALDVLTGMEFARPTPPPNLQYTANNGILSVTWEPSLYHIDIIKYDVKIVEEADVSDPPSWDDPGEILSGTGPVSGGVEGLSFTYSGNIQNGVYNLMVRARPSLEPPLFGGGTESTSMILGDISLSNTRSDSTSVQNDDIQVFDSVEGRYVPKPISDFVSSGGVSDGDMGDIVVSGGGTVWSIDASAVTNAKLADIGEFSLKGRVSSGTGSVEDITQSSVLTSSNVGEALGWLPLGGGLRRFPINPNHNRELIRFDSIGEDTLTSSSNFVNAGFFVAEASASTMSFNSGSDFSTGTALGFDDYAVGINTDENSLKKYLLGQLSSKNNINNTDWSGTDLSVANGGTGRSSHTAYAVLCGGTSTTGPQQSVSGTGSAGQVLTSSGPSSLPTWQNAGGGTELVLDRQTSNQAIGTSDTSTQLSVSLIGGVNYGLEIFIDTDVNPGFKMTQPHITISGSATYSILLARQGLRSTGNLSWDGASGLFVGVIRPILSGIFTVRLDRGSLTSMTLFAGSWIKLTPLP